MEGSHYQIKLERSVNNMKETLKPCPFCGGDEVIVQLDPGFFPMFYVGCHNCGGSATYCEKREDAIEAWNGRFNPPAALQNLDISV